MGCPNVAIDISTNEYLLDVQYTPNIERAKGGTLLFFKVKRQDAVTLVNEVK